MKKIGLFIVIMLALAATGYAEEIEKRIELGYSYIESGNYKRAARLFESITRTNPDNAEAYVGLGVSKLNLGHNEAMTNPQIVQEAVDALQTAVSLDPNHPEGHYNLGIAYLAIDDKDGAIEEYEALKDTDNQLADQLNSQIKGKKITIYTKIGESGSKWQPTPAKSTGVEQPVYTEDPIGQNYDNQGKIDDCRRKAMNFLDKAQNVKLRSSANILIEASDIQGSACQGLGISFENDSCLEDAMISIDKAVNLKYRSSAQVQLDIAKVKINSCLNKKVPSQHRRSTSGPLVHIGGPNFVDSNGKVWHCPSVRNVHAIDIERDCDTQ